MSSVFLVELERGINPISARRVDTAEGQPIRTVEQALLKLNENVSCPTLKFRMFGDASGRQKPLVYGMLKHCDGIIQMVVETKDLGAACNIAVGLRLRQSA